MIRNYNIVAHDKSQWINEIVNIGYKRSRVPSKKENHILSISISMDGGFCQNCILLTLTTWI